MSRWIAALAFVGACSTDTFSGDAFPIHVDVGGGPVLAQVTPAGGARAGETLTASVDVLAPFTLVDPGEGGAIAHEDISLTLSGLRAHGGTTWVPRAELDLGVFALHPCEAATCTVGPVAAPIALGAVIGADAFASDAVRLDLGAGDLFLLPDIAGDDEARSRQCDAVFASPFRGGGTLVLGGTEVAFAGRRVAVGACLAPAPTALDPVDRGTNVLLVVSTGLGPSLLAASAYQRYCQVASHGCDPDPASLPATSVLLPSGAIAGGAFSIPSVALVGTPSSNARGPCQDLHASHALVADCVSSGPLCPDSGLCGAPAAVELGTAIDVVVVPDAEPTLQALRAELRPDQAEVDGILGTSALTALELDVDYPHGRLLARCNGAACAVRPRLPSCSFLDRVRACLP